MWNMDAGDPPDAADTVIGNSSAVATMFGTPEAVFAIMDCIVGTLYVSVRLVSTTPGALPPVWTLPTWKLFEALCERFLAIHRIGSVLGKPPALFEREKVALTVVPMLVTMVVPALMPEVMQLVISVELVPWLVLLQVSTPVVVVNNGTSPNERIMV